LPFVRTAFEVEIASTGRRIRIPANRNVLDVLADHGVQIPWSCGVGVCGTCRTRVLAGEPDHWDSVLRPAEKARGDVFMPCCSRAKTALLKLDL
jgi:vanillate O-demethylase ferredoxin subunit